MTKKIIIITQFNIFYKDFNFFHYSWYQFLTLIILNFTSRLGENIELSSYFNEGSHNFYLAGILT